MSSKLHDEHFQPVFEVVARLISLKQNTQDVRGRARARVRKASNLFDQPVGVIVNRRERGDRHKESQRALVNRG